MYDMMAVYFVCILTGIVIWDMCTVNFASFQIPQPPGNLWFVWAIGSNVKCPTSTNHKLYVTVPGELKKEVKWAVASQTFLVLLH